jgi:hypothetical protein
MLLAAGLPEASSSRLEHLRQARRDIDELGLRRLREFEPLTRGSTSDATSVNPS